MMYLLDTNVVSEMRKIRAGKANPGVAAWNDGVSAGDMYLSVVTVHELELGVLLLERRDPTQGALMRGWLEQQVLPAFSGRILPVDLAVTRCSARLHVPNPCSFAEGLIAATALVHRMTVVTRNTADFVASGVSTFNPWR